MEGRRLCDFGRMATGYRPLLNRKAFLKGRPAARIFLCVSSIGYFTRRMVTVCPVRS